MGRRRDEERDGNRQEGGLDRFEGESLVVYCLDDLHIQGQASLLSLQTGSTHLKHPDVQTARRTGRDKRAFNEQHTQMERCLKAPIITRMETAASDASSTT